MRLGESPEVISARVTGALFFTGFGCLWLFTGFSALGQLNIVTAAGVAIIGALLVTAALRIQRRAAKAAQTQTDDEANAETKRVFNRVNTIQWIGVGAVLVLANIFHQPQLIVPAIATVVGLHLFPLARLFRYPMHYVTGTLLIAWSAGIVILLRREDIASVGALGTAAILLLSATCTLTLAARAAGR